MTTATVTGSCMCGATRWRASGPARYRMICHCTSCRRAVGSNAVPWATYPRDAFVLEGEAPARYASSPGVVRTFCAHCGTSLTYENESRPDEIDVTQGSLDDPNAVGVEGRIWLEDAAAWETTTHELPMAARGGPLPKP